jgi:hypothetical protein
MPLSEDPLTRNQKIVTDCDVLIACPKAMQEEQRGSGTWMTIRYARKVEKRYVVIYPSGELGV